MIFRNGYHCPSTYNAADWLIGVLSKSEEGKDGNSVAQQLCDAFDSSRQKELTQISNSFIIENENKQYEMQKPLWIVTVYWLIYRNLLIVARDPSIQKIRILQKIVN